MRVLGRNYQQEDVIRAMVEASPDTLSTVVVVTVSVMAFFTVSAANRIDEFKPGNMKAVSILTLVGSWCLLGLIVLNSGAFSETPALFAGLKVVFAGFVVTSGVLIFELLDDLEECWRDPDFSLLHVSVSLGFIFVFLYGLLLVEPL